MVRIRGVETPGGGPLFVEEAIKPSRMLGCASP
jgi:hypothetical protein